MSADNSHSTATQFSDSQKSSFAFDAGIVFANEASYVCIPLEKFRINPAQEIVLIKSSCECVRPSVVRYLLQQKEEGVALRLDFVDDTKGQVEINPISLAVEIKFQFASGTEQSTTIQFLHTMKKGKAS